MSNQSPSSNKIKNFSKNSQNLKINKFRSNRFENERPIIKNKIPKKEVEWVDLSDQQQSKKNNESSKGSKNWRRDDIAADERR